MGTPTAPSDRHAALDVLRGFALLGILPMNVQAMAMPGSAYTNPASYGDLTGVNRAVWIVSHVLTDMKMMAIFSMLFGAGVCLFAERAQAKHGASTLLHYRRNLALLVIGLLHAWLLFHGDILVHYALCAFVIYLFRNARPRTLVIVGSLLLAVPVVVYGLGGLAMRGMPADVVAKIAVDAGWAPPPDKIAAQLEGMRGSLIDQIRTRAPTTIALETFVFAIFFVWRVSGLMLLGMALYKTGFLLARLPTSTYARVAMLTLPIGFALALFGASMNFRAGWTFEYSMLLGPLPNYFGSLAIALGYISLVAIALQREWLPSISKRLAAVGRMAFTNYLMHSVLAVVVFNFGGLFGAPRWQQASFVVVVWILQLAWSPLWLKRYAFGPVEWLWRAATYGKRPQWRAS